MHDTVSALPRINLPCTPVNKGKIRGRGEPTLGSAPSHSFPRGGYLTLHSFGFGSSTLSPSSVVLVGMMNAT
jgi:hypothetical protein